MEERGRNVAVGLTTIAGLTVFAFLLLLFGQVPQWLDSGYHVQVVLPDSGGLVRGSRVKLSGKDVGHVTSVTLQPSPNVGVIVALSIQEDLTLPANVEPRVTPPLLGGSPSMSLHISHLTEEQRAEALPKDGSAKLVGIVPPGFSDVANQVTQFRANLEEPLRKFSTLSDELGQLSKTWNSVGQSVNTLVESRTTASVDAGQAPPNLATVLARTDARLRDLEPTVAALNTLLSDKETVENIRLTLANARDATAQIRDAAESVEKLAEGSNASVQAVSERLFVVADELSVTISTVNDIMAKVSEGNGTAAMFLNDPSLYRNLDDTAVRLKTAVEQVTLMLRQWREEGLPVNLFE